MKNGCLFSVGIFCETRDFFTSRRLARGGESHEGGDRAGSGRGGRVGDAITSRGTRVMRWDRVAGVSRVGVARCGRELPPSSRAAGGLAPHVGLYWGSYLGLGGGVDVGDVGGDAGGARDIVEGELGHEGVLRRMAGGVVGQSRRRDRGGSSIGPLRGFRESEDGWERRRTIFMRRPQGWPMPPAAPRTATL